MNGQHDADRDAYDVDPEETGVLPRQEAADESPVADSIQNADSTQVAGTAYVGNPYAEAYRSQAYGTRPDHDLAAAAALTGTEEPEDHSGFHPVHVAHLVMGIAFLAFAGIWAALASDVVEGDDLRWLLPVPWLLAGSVGLVASVAGRRARLERQRQRRAHGG